MASAIDPVFKSLIDLGMPQVLSFIITFAIILGILTKSKIFGKEGDHKRADQINIVVSLAISAFVLISPIGATISIWFTQFFIHLLVGLVLLLGIFLYLGFVGHEFGKIDKPSNYMKLGYAVLGIFVVWIFMNGLGFDLFGLKTGGINPLPAWQIPPELLNQLFAVVIILGVLGGSMYALLKGKDESKPKT